MQISIANIIRGTLIGNTMSVLTRYISRVVNGGGIVEAPQCVETALNSQSLLQQASLLVVPSGYKGGTLYSEIPTNGNGDLTWTRGSDAFRTNASGLIQRVPWNLLQRSEEFDNAAWNKTNVTISSNTTNAPNGTTTADTVIMTGTNSQSRSFQQLTSVGNSLTNTFSIYIKYVDRPFIQLVWGTAFSTSDYANFNIENGTITGGTYTNASIVNVGDSWFRISITTAGLNTTPYAYAWFIDSGTAFRATASSGGGSYFIWGAQLVEGTTAQTYLPTTDRLNFPRLSYMYGSCPAVLLEPQRTNLVLQSQDFDNASWVKTNITISANTTTSPDGTTNADKIIATTTNDLHICESSSNSFVSGTTYTFSFYAKKSENDFIQFTASSSLLSTRANFNISNGTLGTVDAGLTASIMSANDGWYRCVITFTASATGSYRIIICAITTSTAVRFQTFAGNGTSGLFIYGAQLEAGAYPTTYISTTSATATRVADSFSRNNIYTNGLITASGGTWFVELRGNVPLTRDTFTVGLYISDTTNISNNNINIRNGGGASRVFINKVISGVSTPLYLTTTDTTKLAIKWNGTTADIFANGTKVVSATAFTPTNMEFLRGDSTQVPVFIQQMALYPSPLSDTDCTTLTTL